MLRVLSTTVLRKFLRNPAHAFSRGKEMALSRLAASFGRGYSPFVRNVTFFLTYRCNLRCRVCGQWGVDGYAKRFDSGELQDEVDVETLKRVVDDIAPGKPQVTLCGGEVLLHDGWLDFVRHVKSRRLTCVLTTNGTLLEGYCDDLVAAGLDKLSISLDGPEAVHNAARGGGDVFGRAMKSIRKIGLSKSRLGAQGPELEIGCTISDQNYHHLDEVVAVAEEVGARCLVLLHLVYVTENELQAQSKLFRDVFETGSVHWSGYRYSPDGIDPDDLSRRLEDIASRHHDTVVLVHPHFTPQEVHDYYRSEFFLSSSYRNECLAPWTSTYILPNGDVSPCSSFVAGNIKRESFVDIWNNERYRFFRRKLRQLKRFPVCARCCELYK
jgi:MoaA/NifB/PqqE/SkfB family radical SAM enzyme